MLFKLTNVLVTFQIIINNILKIMLNRFVIIYLDDIAIYSKILIEHITHVKQILKVLINRSF